MKRTMVWVLTGVVGVTVGCGKSGKEREVEKARNEFQAAAEQLARATAQTRPAAGGRADAATGAEAQDMARAMEALGQAASGGVKVDPVDFRELKKLLPDAIAELPRKESSGERNSAMGMTVSEATASYAAEDGEQRMSLKIADMGSMQGFMGMAGAAWAMADVDRETDSGYERTTQVDGHRALESYDREDRHGEFEILVARRFMVNLEGYGVTEKQLQAAAKALPLAKLAAMKDVGVQK